MNATRTSLVSLVTLALAAPVLALGTLTAREIVAPGTPRPAPATTERAAQPLPADLQAIVMRDHKVRVTINNGFARTEVSQVFFNPNAQNLEAVYGIPLPKSASLAEMTIFAGERTLRGEVLKKEDARKAYEEEKKNRNDTGLAEQDGYRRFEFAVSPVRANAETRVRVVYYQPLGVDAGVGRYVYPVEEGGTDDAATSFWKPNVKPAAPLDVEVDIRSEAPVADVRVTGAATAAVQRRDAFRWNVKHRAPAGSMRDFVLYYRLEEKLPGRVELLTYRPAAGEPGTFMMIHTPGIDLKPIESGADYTFVLDVSGSMSGKIATLARGVVQALGELKQPDRFRVIRFSDDAQVVVDWTEATAENVRSAAAAVQALRSNGGTNIYNALQKGLADLESRRVQSVVLVTDGVANQGIVDAARFRELLRGVDVRVFGFLMGNSANWPLLETITKASGGFYAAVSNDDDIVGQLLLAKGKITSEALHDVKLEWAGVNVQEVGEITQKLYYGQQLVIFGRYQQPGKGEVKLTTKISGEAHTYSTRFELPVENREFPELERLWAMARIDELVVASDAGLVAGDDAKRQIAKLGVDYQLVTDHTSMVVMGDESFAVRGIERRNRERVAAEDTAQTARAAQWSAPPRTAPPVTHQVDAAAPTYPSHSSSVGRRGGGALDPLTVLAVLTLAGLAVRKEA